MQKTLDRTTVFHHFLVQVEHFPSVKQVALSGHGLAFSALLHGKPVRGMVLAKSSEYWVCRLHLQRATPGLIVCYRHDSVVPVDVAKERQLPCPAGGYLQVQIGLVSQQFGELLQGLSLPEHWRDEIRQRMLEEAKMEGQDRAEIEREKERLRLKRTRILKQHRDGYIDDEELAAEIAAVELLLRGLESPEVAGVRLDEVIKAGERLPGMAALWDVATVEERREMATQLLEPGGLYYDLELKMIAALKPHPVFLPTLRMIEGVIEYKEATGLLVVSLWQQTN